MSRAYLMSIGCRALDLYESAQLLHPFRSKHLLCEALAGGSSPLLHE